MAGHKGQLALLYSIFAPAEVMLRRIGGFVVLISSKHGEVQAVPGEREVIGIAAKGRDVFLRSHYQPYIRVFLVLVEVVLAAGKESDHVAPVTGSLAALVL